MKKKLIMFLLVMAALSMPVSAQEVVPNTCEESITAESVPYVEDAALSLPVKYNTRRTNRDDSTKKVTWKPPELSKRLAIS